MKSFLEINNLKKKFGEREIFSGISFTVEKNEVLSIIGQSGTGKSVLLKSIIGIIKPDEGNVFIDGKELYDDLGRIDTEQLEKMGILFQGAALFDSLNVYENICFGLKRKGKGHKAIETKVCEVMNNLGLKGFENKNISELSGGIQKRVGLARAVVMEPEIMLYDEPTTGVDPITGGVVNRLILDTRNLYGATSIVVTHDIESACEISDRVMMLQEGEIVFSGTPRELLNSDNSDVLNFIRRRHEVIC